MKNKKVEKDLDAVEMMRQIRNELSDKYCTNPALEDEELEQVRSKYNIQLKKAAEIHSLP